MFILTEITSRPFIYGVIKIRRVFVLPSPPLQPCTAITDSFRLTKLQCEQGYY